MAALTADRVFKSRKVYDAIQYKVKASTTIYAGAIVAVDASGYVVPGDDASGQTVVGIAVAQANNSAGASGDISVEVQTGIFSFNGGGTAPTIANVGSTVTVETDNEVALAADTTNDIIAGRLVEIDGTEFYVRIGNY